MKTQSGLKKLLIFVAAIGLTMRVHADATSTPGHAPGAIVGIVRNADKVAVSGATVTAVRSDDGAIRATLSGSDGVYSFADLAPGTWYFAVVDYTSTGVESSFSNIASKTVQ